MVSPTLNQNPTSRDSVNRFAPERIGQWQASLIALLITLILHVVVFVVLPDEVFIQQSVPDESIELTLEPFDPETLQYVEINPEAPENEPDRKDNYSFRSQQAADESSDALRNDTPAVDGDEASQKIVQGAVDPSESMPLENGVYTLSDGSVESPDESSDAARASRAISPPPLPPPPDFIQQKPEVDEGPGSRLEITDSSPQVLEEDFDINTPLQLYRVDSENQQDQDASRASDGATESKPLPRKRLTLSPDLVHGPLMRSKGSVDRRGALAIDATFSQFGEYEQQFYAAVQAGWYQEIDFFQPIDTSARVVVRFRIQSDGTIDEVTILHSTAGEIATLICQTALTKRSPFRPWTAEMVQVFGQERVMEVAFSYR